MASAPESPKRAAQQAREQGIKVGCIRPITLWPFPSAQISKVADKSPIFLVVEMSCGQMVEDVRLAVAGKTPVVFWGRPGGGVPTVEQVLEKIEQLVTRASSPCLHGQSTGRLTADGHATKK